MADPLIQYVKYLRELTERIYLRGMDRMLVRARDRKYFRRFDATQPTLNRYTGRFIEHQSRLAHKGERVTLVLGCGAIVGKVRLPQREVQVAGPLIICPIELDDDNGDEPYELLWDEAKVNLHLLQTVLRGDVDELDYTLPDNAIDPAVFNTVEAIESGLDHLRDSLTFGYAGYSQFLGRAFRQLQDVSPPLATMMMIQSRYDQTDIDKALKQKAIFLPDAYFAVAAEPNELTTLTALDQLLDCLNNETPGDPTSDTTIVRVLRGALCGRPAKPKHGATDPDRIETALRECPLPLSARQQKAVRNAWSFDASYVQGPPGTGKSHTIAAMMICGLLMGKKVLLVSHKRPAVEVVHEKLAEDGALGQIATIYAGSDKDIRHKVREQLQVWLTYSEGARRDVKSAVTKTQESADGLSQQLRSTEALLKTALKRCSSYTQAMSQLEDCWRKEWGVRPDLVSRLKRQGIHRTAVTLNRISDGLANCTARRSDILRGLGLIHDLRHAFDGPFELEIPGLGRWPLAISFAEALSAYKRLETARGSLDPSGISPLAKEHQEKSNKLAEARVAHAQAFWQHAIVRAGKLCGDEFQAFRRVLYATNRRRIKQFLQQVDFRRLVEACPLWVGEMRDLDRCLPMEPGLFDLVIVDEASQVNIMEIVPALYRGKQFCVVGDHKQLGLESAGLQFLGEVYERLVWKKHIGDFMRYEPEAKEACLLGRVNSILDLIRTLSGLPTETLDEHWRSVPGLAHWTSEQFYADEGRLKIMREVGDTVELPCFEGVCTGGSRDPDQNVVWEEVEELFRQLHALIVNQEHRDRPKWNRHRFSGSDGRPTLGILCVLRDTADLVSERVESEFTQEQIDQYQVMVGTPEEFQGHERDIMFLVMGLGEDGKWAKGHYEQPNRFNVGTSRAKCVTVVIYGQLPATAQVLRDYLAHFGSIRNDLSLTNGFEPVHGIRPGRKWTYDRNRYESEFEQRVAEYLEVFAREHEAKLFNQVERASDELGVSAAGQKRLDFVLYSPSTGRTVAVEVDGQSHFVEGGRDYTEEHRQRIDVLRRAGWRIVHVPYYKWWRGGWLADREDAEFKKTVADLYRDLRTELELT